MNYKGEMRTLLPQQHKGISWRRPTIEEVGDRKDTIGIRTREDDSRELLMHNEALCHPYYVATLGDKSSALPQQACSCGYPSVKCDVDCNAKRRSDCTRYFPIALPQQEEPAPGPRESRFMAIMNSIKDEEADYIIGRCIPLLQILLHEGNEHAKEVLDEIKAYCGE